jgi:hypothetical protein
MSRVRPQRYPRTGRPQEGAEAGEAATDWVAGQEEEGAGDVEEEDPPRSFFRAQLLVPRQIQPGPL